MKHIIRGQMTRQGIGLFLMNAVLSAIVAAFWAALARLAGASWALVVLIGVLVLAGVFIALCACVVSTYRRQ